MTWELRWHPFRAEWVLFTAHRGARSSGGGSGGTVVVVCERGTLDDVEALVR